MQSSMAKCKKRLGVLWFVGFVILFFFLLIQSILGHYEDKTDEAWGWFFPSIMPTLSLIVAVIVMDAKGKSVKTSTIDSYIFYISFFLSIAYIISMFLTILIQPFVSPDPLELMKQSNIWMGPFQGLVSASLGVFFVKRETD